MTIMSRQLFGTGLGAFGEPMISPVAAPFVGGVLAALTTLGIRIFAPVNNADGEPGWWYKHAPLVGAGAGAVVGGAASYWLGGEDLMSAGLAAGGAALATATMYGGESYNRYLGKAADGESQTRFTEIMAALNGGAAALPPGGGGEAGAEGGAGTSGVGNVRYMQGGRANMNRWGQGISG